MSQGRYRRARGFTLLETLAVLAIAALLLVGLSSLMSTASGNARAQQAALYQAQVSSAGMQLIKANYQALLTAPMTTTTPLVISLTGSNPAGYKLGSFLPASILARNAYQQVPCLLVYRGTGTGWTGGTGPQDILAFLVTEGGQTIDDHTLGNIEANAGAGAGAIQSISGGVAQGAFGSWSASLAAVNPTNTSCSGTATGVGHLVSQVYYSGGNGAAGDFLYRQPSSVTGVADGNTMHAPIVLADQTHTDRDGADPTCAAATDLGKITADSAGNVLNCTNMGSGIQWNMQASLHWRAPADTLGNIASYDPSPETGDVLRVADTGIAYAYTGAKWMPLAVDNKGNLTVPGLIEVTNTQVIGQACTPSSASETQVAADTTGRLLSCQNGLWESQSEVVPAGLFTGCQMLMTSPGAADYPSCALVSSATYTTAPFSFDNTTGTYTYQYNFTITLQKSGIISVTTWAHMNDGVCQLSGGKANNQAQLAQQVYLYDSTNKQLGQAAAQSPTLIADSDGINNTLVEAQQAGTYTITVNTQWATYVGITTPWTSSFCYNNTTVPNSPVAWGWTVNTYY